VGFGGESRVDNGACVSRCVDTAKVELGARGGEAESELWGRDFASRVEIVDERWLADGRNGVERETHNSVLGIEGETGRLGCNRPREVLTNEEGE
jgi:hypothetical protein